MEFSDSQKATIGEWVAEGLKLSDVQSRINEIFGVSLTYIDVRLLIDDLNLVLVDQPKPVDRDLRNAPPLPPEQANDSANDSAMGEQPGSETGVLVSLHKIYKPGSIVSGEVEFSDGEKAGWSLDQVGRLALSPSTKAYQPSETDVQDFQKKLSRLLQSQGYQ